MKPFEKLSDAPFLFFLLRLATVLVALTGTWFAWMMLYTGLFTVSVKPFGALNVAGAAGMLTVVIASVCAYVALFTFFRLCGRLARGTAFTEQNAAAMRRIALALLIAGLCAFAGITAVALLIGGIVLPIVYLYVIAAALLGAALVSHALAVLVRRAVALQQDSDLTI